MRTPRARPVWLLVGLALAWVLTGFTGCKSMRGRPVGEDQSPYGLGQKMAEVHAAALAQTLQLAKDRPTGQDLLDQLDKLHEQTAKELIALGYERQDLTTPDRAICDRAFRGGLMDRTEAEYAALEAVHRHYPGQGQPAVATRLEDMNMLMVFPNFRLLAEELPEQAAKFGVDKAIVGAKRRGPQVAGR